MSGGRIVQSAFNPAWWLPGTHLQTLWPYLFRRIPAMEYRHERLELADGDFVDCCWSGNGTGPIVAVFHGLEGSIRSPYAAAIMAAIHHRRWRGVFMHFRGCSGEANRLIRSYHSGDTGDIAFLLQTLAQRYPHTAIGAIGYSLGGNALLKYLGETGHSSLVKAAVAVSVPYLLHDSVARLSRGLSRIYQWRLLRSLHRKIRTKSASAKTPSDIDELHTLDTFYKFDDRITAPLHGFAGADDYYTRSSSLQYLPRIQTPTLLIHAKNDPFMTPSSIPDKKVLPENVILELSDKGGHAGFVGGILLWKPVYWLEQRIPEFLTHYLQSM